MTEGMRFRDHSVTQVMVGLHRVGFVGLREIFEEATRSGLQGREELVDVIVARLAEKNYVPAPDSPDLRDAMWREYLRYRGRDFSPFFSKVDIIVRGEPGDERDRFVGLVRDALAELELQPVVTFEPPAGPSPQLVIRGEVVASGTQTRRGMYAALRRTLSGW